MTESATAAAPTASPAQLEAERRALLGDSRSVDQLDSAQLARFVALCAAHRAALPASGRSVQATRRYASRTTSSPISSQPAQLLRLPLGLRQPSTTFRRYATEQSSLHGKVNTRRRFLLDRTRRAATLPLRVRAGTL